MLFSFTKIRAQILLPIFRLQLLQFQQIQMRSKLSGRKHRCFSDKNDGEIDTQSKVTKFLHRSVPVLPIIKIICKDEDFHQLACWNLRNSSHFYQTLNNARFRKALRANRK